MGKNPRRIRVEIVAKKKGCLLCDLAVAILEEIQPEFEEGTLTWEVVDVVMSNGALNRMAEKEEVLSAALRLLKPGDRLFIADQFLVAPISKVISARIKSWFQWKGGAVPEMDFLADVRKTGFVDVASWGETGFNSSPKTKGMLVRARKPGLQSQKNAAAAETGGTRVPSDAEGAPPNEPSKIYARKETHGHWNFALVLIE